MHKKILLLFLFSASLSFGQIQGVGINETVPEQKLHLGSQVGTIRVDGLNGANNSYNGGVAGQTYPVYVDSNGDLTLEITALDNSDGGDPWSTNGINGTVEILSTGVNDGYEYVEMLDYVVTIDRKVNLEVKYSMSIEVFEDSALNIIKDAYARNISNFFTLNEPTLSSTGRRYGQSSRCYFNRNDAGTNPAAAPNAATGFIYNTGSTYLPLDPGTHTLRFYGTVCSGDNNHETFVRFAGGPDALFLRLH